LFSITQSADAVSVSTRDQAATLARRQEALYSLATSPLKQVGITAFMMWMAGAQLHFFSIMATINGIYSPLKAIMNSGEGGF
jgi:hypothetical protein